jgi:hypothetical protein
MAREVELDLVTLDAEKIKRVLTNHGVAPPVVDLLLEIHDTQRTTEKLLSKLIGDMSGVVEALVLINKNFMVHKTSIENIKRQFGNQNVKDVLTEEHKRD